VSASQLEIRVALDDQDEYVVTTRLSDHNLWDVTRAKHKWPTPGDAPLTWLGFLAWAASRRAGKIPASLTWEQFLAACEGVENITEDETTADPTIPGPGPG
jgi:hypothetical protein